MNCPYCYATIDPESTGTQWLQRIYLADGVEIPASYAVPVRKGHFGLEPVSDLLRSLSLSTSTGPNL